jgi:hypothetical protein
MTKFLGFCAGTAALVLVLAPHASAQTITMVATLTGGEESPPVLTGAAGTAEVSIDVTNREFLVTLKVFNLPTGSTGSHIHVGPRGPTLAGPVVITFPFPNGTTGDIVLKFRVGPAQFSARPDQGINTIDDVIQAVLAGNGYINVHTTANRGGEIRGQLTLP